jgi:hypothetical protein
MDYPKHLFHEANQEQFKVVSLVVEGSQVYPSCPKRQCNLKKLKSGTAGPEDNLKCPICNTVYKEDDGTNKLFFALLPVVE